MLTTEALIDVAEETSQGIDFRIASTREERAAAFHLVYKSYLRAGLGEPNPYRARVTPYHLLPTTEVFVASIRDEIFFTMSLVSDGELGLPMESVYGDVVQGRRQQGIRMAEVSCLADRRAELRGFFPIFLRLSSLLAQYATGQGIDQLLVAVHPRHARFYRRLLGFRTIGEEKSYPTVRNHPAVALCLDLHQVAREQGKAYELLFTPTLPAEQLLAQPISEADRAYFEPMVDLSFSCAPMLDSEGYQAADEMELLGSVSPRLLARSSV